MQLGSHRGYIRYPCSHTQRSNLIGLHTTYSSSQELEQGHNYVDLHRKDIRRVSICHMTFQVTFRCSAFSQRVHAPCLAWPTILESLCSSSATLIYWVTNTRCSFAVKDDLMLTGALVTYCHITYHYTFLLLLLLLLLLFCLFVCFAYILVWWHRLV